MFSLKTIGVALLLAVACATASDKPVTASDKLVYKVDVAQKLAAPASTTVAAPEPKTPNTTTIEPSTSPASPPTPPTPPKTTTIEPNTTTVAPTTTPVPKTTTVAPTSTSSPNTTTPVPTTTSSPITTISPNGTTTVAPSPAPAPTPGRNWDGPSFFGGMVLAFGLVGIGYVGYRFFYLGRGGAYHTL